MWVSPGLIPLITLIISPTSATKRILERDDEGSAFNRSFSWGPYRPNLYFGVRARTPDSPLIGLMWTRRDGDKIVEETLRHTCEQSDDMEAYGWTAYDPYRGGSQSIRDVGNGLDLTTDFVRLTNGSQDEQWAARVTGEPRAGLSEKHKSFAVFYIGMDSEQANSATTFKCESMGGRIVCTGGTDHLGSFRLSLARAAALGSGAEPKIRLRGVSITDDTLWEAKSIYLQHRRNGNWNPPTTNSNLYFIELEVEGAFEFDILFAQHTVLPTIASANLTHAIPATLESFSSHFDVVLKPKYPFNTEAYANLSKALVSNLLGGIGYFYGDSRVDRSHSPAYQERFPEFWKSAEAAMSRNAAQVTPANPAELFTMVPSRAFFPRGFLWDEGFHLLVLVEWDMDMAVEILMSWFNLMDDEGYIAREQILGAEAREKVPSEFIIQYPHHANPPTLFLAVTALTEILLKQKEYFGHRSQYFNGTDSPKTDAAMSLMNTMYPLMRRHFDWFQRTQAGSAEYERPEDATEGYRWRGRTPQHTLTSGLDDYPRSEVPHPGELHVDAISWVGTMAVSLAKVAQFLGRQNEREYFDERHAEIVESIDALHWSTEDQAYCDSTVDRSGQHTHVCHKGYVSLFPFMLGHMDPEFDERISSVLDMLHNPLELWSPYGVRSLSKDDSHYGTGENYWRSPVWININYLILKQLTILLHVRGPHHRQACEVYHDLRHNVVTTLYDSWLETGFAWEQYNPDTGQGQRTQQFTGWTALVVKILNMPDHSSGLAGYSERFDPLCIGSWELQPGDITWTSDSRFLTAVAFCMLLLFFFRRRIYRLAVR